MNDEIQFPDPEPCHTTDHGGLVLWTADVLRILGMVLCYIIVLKIIIEH